MALSDIFGGLLGGGSNPYDMYGDLFSEKQREALRQRELSGGLLRFAEKLGAASAPSRTPKGSFLGLLGQSLGGFAPSDEAANKQLEGMAVAEKVRQARQERDLLSKLTPLQLGLLERQMKVPPGTYGGPKEGLPTGMAAPGAAPGAPTTVPMTVPGQSPSATAADTAAAVPAGAPAVNAFGLPQVPSYNLPTPADPPFGGGALPQQQNTGLLGAPVGAPDQVVGPDGQPLRGSGLFPNMLAGYGGAPGGMLPFRLASATPTGGVTPGADGADDWQRVKPLIRKFESGNRNIEQGVVGPQGGYNPSVGRVTGPSSASGYYQMIDPTWRQAARMVGIDTDKYPRAIDAPEELQDKAAEALYREQGLRPWAPYNKRLAAATDYQGGGQDVVIPSGRGVPRSALTNVADTGGAAGEGQGGVIPGLGVTPEALATLNALMRTAGMKSSPFDSLLETYYKSPGYLEEKARTEEAARKKIGLEYDPLIAAQTETAKAKVELEYKPKIEEAVQKLQSPILKEREQAKADIDRYSRELEQNRQAGLTPVDATLVGQDGQLTTQKITALEFAKRQRERADRIAKGNTALVAGDIVGAPTGNLPPGYQHRITPEGTITAGPVPNTPAAREEAEAVEKKRLSEAQKQTTIDFVVTDIDRIRQKVKASPFTTTGVVGGWLSGVNQTDAGFIRNAVEGLEANILLDRMLALKAASPTGASGLGSLTEQEGQRLVRAYGSLKQSQDTEDFLYNLDRVQRLYLEFVHGPVVAQQMMANRPEVAGPGAARAAAPAGADPAKEAYDKLPPGSTYTDPTGTRRIKP